MTCPPPRLILLPQAAANRRNGLALPQRLAAYLEPHIAELVKREAASCGLSDSGYLAEAVEHYLSVPPTQTAQRGMEHRRLRAWREKMRDKQGG